MKVNIRPARLSDVPGIAQVLTVSFYSQRWLHFFWEWAIGVDVRCRLLEANKYYTCLIAVTPEGQPIATIEMCIRRFRPWQNSQYPYIFNLAVHPHWRRQGIASQLLQATEPIAKSWGFSQIFIHVMANNQPAYALYQQANYIFYRYDRNLFNFNRLLLCKTLTNSPPA
ncbi:MAG: GNAT family N-acetyltransferase [Pseudanabaenaceae cyanobacterium]